MLKIAFILLKPILSNIRKTPKGHARLFILIFLLTLTSIFYIHFESKASQITRVERVIADITVEDTTVQKTLTNAVTTLSAKR